MIDPTKITPEKLAEMNDSLIVDNNYLRQRVRDLEAEQLTRLEAAEEDRDEFQKVITAIGNAAKGYDFSGGLANYVAAMQEKLESAERDMARYRWLRVNNIIANIKFNFIEDSYYVYGEALDIEIDAAMKELP